MLSMILYKIIKVYQKIPVEEDKKHQINKTKTVKKAKKVGRPKMKEEDKKNVLENKKVGRNEKCPCGSEKKFKHCCGSV